MRKPRFLDVKNYFAFSPLCFILKLLKSKYKKIQRLSGLQSLEICFKCFQGLRPQDEKMQLLRGKVVIGGVGCRHMTALRRTEHNAALRNCRHSTHKGPYVASSTPAGELLVTHESLEMDSLRVLWQKNSAV